MNEPQAPVFPNTIPFLMHCITTKVVGEATEEFLAMGFNVQSARVMIALHVNPRLRVGEVAELTCIEGSTLSHMLARLSREKLVRRRRDPEDFRSVSVSLTAKGRRLAKSCFEASLEHERRLMEGTPPPEARMLRAVLLRMFENARRLETTGRGSDSGVREG